MKTSLFVHTGDKNKGTMQGRLKIKNNKVLYLERENSQEDVIYSPITPLYQFLFWAKFIGFPFNLKKAESQPDGVWFMVCPYSYIGLGFTGKS